MEDLMLNIPQSFSLSGFFLEDLWDYCKGKLSEKDIDHLGSILGTLHCDSGCSLDWLNSVVAALNGKVTHISWKSNLEISSHVAFDALLNFCDIHYTQYGYDFPGVIELLKLMQKNPKEYELEWDLWQKSIQRALSGDSLEFSW